MHKKLKDWMWLAPLCVGALATAAIVPFGATDWRLALLFLPVFLGLSLIERWPYLLPWLLGNRGLVLLLSMLALVCLAGFSRSRQAPTALEPIQVEAHFVATGLVLGVLVRDRAGALLVRRLLGRSRHGAEALFLCCWTLTVALYPWSAHGAAGVSYLAGLALGAFAHRGSSVWFERQAAVRRRLAEVADAFRRAPATQDELRALALLKRPRNLVGRFGALRAHLDACETKGSLSKRLHLVSAVAYRLEGDLARSKNAIQDGLASTPTDRDTDTVLRTLNVVTLREMGRDEAVDELLVELDESCPVALATWALVLSEPRDALANDWRPSTTGLDVTTRMFALMDGRTERVPLTRVLDAGLPITSSYFLDVLACCFVAAGQFEVGRLLLERCIVSDPSFSVPYFHLGELFCLRSGRQRPEDAAENRLQARWCFTAARIVERNRDSRIRRASGKYLSALGT
jgi:hypothetical protein